MMRRSLAVACVFSTSLIVGQCLILQDASAAQSDHAEILYLKSVVNGVSNLTDALQKEIASRNDLTQFLQADVTRLNQTLQFEMQQRSVLDHRVRDLETKLRTLTGTSGEKADDITDLQLQMTSLHTDLTGTKLQLNSAMSQNNRLNQTIQNQLSTLTTDLTSLTQSLPASITPIIGFKATGVANRRPSIGEGLIFPTVLLNEGNGYNVTSGIFTAPARGLYLLTVQTCASRGAFHASNIMVQGKEMGRLLTQDLDWSSCNSGNAIAYMEVNDEAYISTTGISRSLSNSGYWLNSFAGALLNKSM